MTALLRLAGVSKAFGGVRALDGVSLDLRAGEVHALIGENGAGKSTLVRIMTGALRADRGSVEVDGRVVERPDPAGMRALGVAPIYQQPALLSELSVAENMAMALEPPSLFRRVDWRQRRDRARELLARVGANVDADAPAGTLRMAEQQLVEIARAIGTRARIFIFDEPTAALTDHETTRLFALVRSLRQDGAACLYISHRLDEVDALADRVTVLRDGRHVATHERGRVSRDELIRLMVGRTVDVPPPPPPPRTDVVLEIEGLRCRAAGLHHVDLRVHAGEIVGLAGLVGAGRTELARVLFGLDRPDEGHVRLGGRTVHIGKPSEAVRLGMAYVPEDRRRHGVIGELAVAANVTLASLERVSRRGVIDRAREEACAQTFVERFSIRTSSVHAPTATLSGGNQQKVALARWLATEPRLLILDEPTQGVDIGAKAEIHRLIGALAAGGLAILLISSELPELLMLCHRIAVMRAGCIAGVLDRRAATEEAILSLALGHTPIASGSAAPQPAPSS